MERDSIDEIIFTLERMDKVDDVRLFGRVGQTVRRRRGQRRLKRFMRVAAVVIPVALAAGIWWFMDRGPGDTGMENNMIAQYTGIPRLIMPDGEALMLDDSVKGRVAAGPNIVIERENGTVVFHTERAETVDAEPHYYGVEVPKGAKLDFILEDGTHVWLNADSRLRYTAFTGNQRRVQLEGEAYFEVAPDAQKPFVVDTRGQELTVLGTEFNISAYKDDPVIYTTLVGGKVSLRSTGSGNQTLLAPGRQARLDRRSDEFSQTTVDTDDVAAWRDGVIVFEGNTLEQMMKKLARVYHMDYVFADKAAKNLVTHGTMPVQEDVTTILRLIEASGRVKFEIKENHIKIKTAE